MANRYWVGGTGNWNGSNTANWSATSGGAGGASVPISSDAVYLNGNSGAGTVTIGASVVANGFDTTGFTGTISGSNIYSMTLFGNGYFRLGAGTTWACAVTVNFTDISVLVFNGVTLGPYLGTYSTLNFQYPSSSTFSDACNSPGVNINVNSTIYVNAPITIADATRAGTFNVTTGSSSTSISSAITAKVISLTVSSATFFSVSSASFTTQNFSCNINGASRNCLSITLDAAAFGETDVFIADNNVAYYQIRPSNIIVQNSYNCTFSTSFYTNSGTFSALGIASTPGSRLTVKSNTTTQRAILANAGTLQNTDFQYIYANGSSIPWTGTSLGNLGNNTNITFNYSPPSTGSSLFFAGTF